LYAFDTVVRETPRASAIVCSVTRSVTREVLAGARALRWENRRFGAGRVREAAGGAADLDSGDSGGDHGEDLHRWIDSEDAGTVSIQRRSVNDCTD
jgi:hypothetical protein